MEGCTKGQVRHGSATTAYASRAAIQRSEASLAVLSRLRINPKTVAKWRKRVSVEDMKTGPKEPRSTVLTTAEEMPVASITTMSRADGFAANASRMPHVDWTQEKKTSLIRVGEQPVGHSEVIGFGD